MTLLAGHERRYIRYKNSVQIELSVRGLHYRFNDITLEAHGISHTSGGFLFEPDSRMNVTAATTTEYYWHEQK